MSNFNLNDIKPTRAIIGFMIVLYLSTGYLLMYIFNYDEFYKLEFFKLTLFSISIMGFYFLLTFPALLIIMIENSNDDKDKNPLPHIINIQINSLMVFYFAYFVIAIITFLRIFFNIEIKTALIIIFAFIGIIWIFAIYNVGKADKDKK